MEPRPYLAAAAPPCHISSRSRGATSERCSSLAVEISGADGDDVGKVAEGGDEAGHVASTLDGHRDAHDVLAVQRRLLAIAAVMRPRASTSSRPLTTD